MNPSRRTIITRWLSLLALSFAVTFGVAACNKQATPPPPTAVEATFDVQGMTCASCTVTVRTAAKSVDGVYDARADVGQKRAWVSYDAERTNPAEIAAAITRAGYTATVLRQ